MASRRSILAEPDAATEINLSPMIDCIFILLIFFIVTTVFVDEQGKAARSQIHTSSGYPALDNAAAQIVEQMEFSPAMNRDKPVGVWIAQPIDFSVTR